MVWVQCFMIIIVRSPIMNKRIMTANTMIIKILTLAVAVSLGFFVVVSSGMVAVVVVTVEFGG